MIAQTKKTQKEKKTGDQHKMLNDSTQSPPLPSHEPSTAEPLQSATIRSM